MTIYRVEMQIYLKALDRRRSDSPVYHADPMFIEVVPEETPDEDLYLTLRYEAGEVASFDWPDDVDERYPDDAYDLIICGFDYRELTPLEQLAECLNEDIRRTG